MKTGSSPHVRGTLWASSLTTCSGRFIPACAGNTIEFAELPRRTLVHPRMCGEHCLNREPLPDQDGSSPHVRGTQRQETRPPSQPRFIPACAGNTINNALDDEARPVHPRMCGEHSIKGGCPPENSGSSPHVRGTHFSQLIDK